MRCLPPVTALLARFLVLPLALFALSHSPTSANIFGADDRTPVDSRELPWRCLGVIISDHGSGVATGTGFLIGRNLVLTNSHCTRDDATGEPFERIYFAVNRIDGTASHIAHVNHVWRGTDDDERYDWAVLRLDSNLGDDQGWLTLSDNLPDRATLAGYSGDYRDQQTAAKSPGSLHSVLPWLVFHEADATRGSSGGPLLSEEAGKTVVVALNFGEYRNGDTSLSVEAYDAAHANLALPAASFQAEVEAILADEASQRMANQAQLARRQIAAKQYDEAQDTLSVLLAECPSNAWAALLRGYVYSLTGNAAAADEDFRLAKQIDPDCLNLLLQRASFCYQSANYRECAAIAARVLLASSQDQTAQQLYAAASQRIESTPPIVAGTSTPR